MPARLSRIATGALLSTLLAAGASAQVAPPKAVPRVKAAPASPTSPATASPTPAPAKIDLNRATEAELQELPGIGPARASAIVKARPFRTVDDLKALRGITPAVFAEISPRLTVAGLPTTTAPAPKSATPKVAMPKAKATAPPPIAAPTAKKAASTGATSAAAKEDDPESQARKRAALPPGKTINLNTATAEELETLPYIGPVRAAAIIKARPFAKAEDVMKTEGIKEGIFAHIKEHIRVK